MSDEPVGPEGEEETPPGDPGAGAGVALSREEYRSLVDELSDLKMKVHDYDTARKIAELEKEESKPHLEVPRTQPREPVYVDFDKMSREELAKFVFLQTQKHIEETRIKPIVEMLLTMTAKDEIRDTASRYGDDFWEIKDAVRDYATKNPQTSIEDAYLIVRAKVGPGKAKKEEPKDEVTKPKAPNRPDPFPGERTTVARSSVRTNPSFTSRAAAEKALADIGKGSFED